MFIVTGGAGFIGSNFIKTLNQRGITDILVVDDLTDGAKFVNLVDLQIMDYIDKGDFISQIVSGQDFGNIDTIFHFGACTDLSELNGKFMMENNYEYSKDLLHYCIDRDIAFIYASDAAVYGDAKCTIEATKNEKPASLYAYTKYQFDQYVRQIWADASEHGESLPQVVGLRYTPVEQKTSTESSGLAINEVCKLNHWLLDNPGVSGIYNVGPEAAVNVDKLTAAGYQ